MQPRPGRCLSGCVPASMPVISIPTCAHCNFTRVHSGYIERFGGTSVIEGKGAHVGAATALSHTHMVAAWCWLHQCSQGMGSVVRMLGEPTPCSQWRSRHPRAQPAARRGGTSPPPPGVQRREPVRLDPRRRLVHRSPARASWGLCRQRCAHRAGRWYAVRSSRNAARVHSGGFCAVRFVSARAPSFAWFSLSSCLVSLRCPALLCHSFFHTEQPFLSSALA